MKKKLLLADDSVTVQRVVELTFADEDVEVASVGDGAAAIERIERDRPDIVLADVSMPERDGYEVADHVKSSPHLAHIPVVLMTGAFEQIDEARASRARCDAVLAKPFEPQMLISLVGQLLQGGASEAAPAAALRPAAAAFPATAAEPGMTLDDYIERLDDALSATKAPVSMRVVEGGVQAYASRSVPPAWAEPAAAAQTAESPTLADAFSLLMAEELGEAPLPSAWSSLAETVSGRMAVASAPAAVPPAAAAAPPPVTEALIEEVTRRVAARLADTAVRDIVHTLVLDVAERLVREEIERIKASAAAEQDS
jgi:CheY-like chemotaxis protein